MDEAGIRQRYGAWDVLRPEDALALLAGFAGPWSVAGGGPGGSTAGRSSTVPSAPSPTSFRCTQRPTSLDEVTWVREDGVRFLAPEVALLSKAKHRRPEDDADLDPALPLLGDDRRGWLREALAELHPGHPWSARLG